MTIHLWLEKKSINFYYRKKHKEMITWRNDRSLIGSRRVSASERNMLDARNCESSTKNISTSDESFDGDCGPAAMSRAICFLPLNALPKKGETRSLRSNVLRALVSTNLRGSDTSFRPLTACCKRVEGAQ